MKKIVFSVVTLFSLMPSASIKAEVPEILRATDPAVLALFSENRDALAKQNVLLLQKVLNKDARIKELEATIDERSDLAGRKKGAIIAGSVGAITTLIAGFIGYNFGYANNSGFRRGR